LINNINIVETHYRPMAQEMVTIPKKEYDELLEEVGILRNSDMMEAIKDGLEAEAQGTKPWKLQL